MKIKSFVTNSSSTNFIIMFDGETKEDLYKILKKYPKFFDLEYTPYDEGTPFKVDLDQVIQAIESVIDKNISYPGTVIIQNIDQVIEERKKQIEHEREYCEKSKAKDPKISIMSLFEWLDENENLLNEISRAKRRGMKSVLEIQFGDNDGHISGGSIGTTMDYQGRYINLSSLDITILTEQNR